jgi:two-component system sensor histidine kinase KdpD
MERLITGLLEMTRLESGGLVLNREWQPLQEVIGSALYHLDHRLRGREVTIHLPANLPLAHIDTVAIEQVLANLLENAVEYTPPGTPIEISARATDNAITVEVADRGPGLPPGNEQRIFDKFVRIHAPQSRHGIGLGLAIARGIVEAHGGQIIASNRTGPDATGAVFRFTIPLTVLPPTVDTSA